MTNDQFLLESAYESIHNATTLQKNTKFEDLVKAETIIGYHISRRSKLNIVGAAKDFEGFHVGSLEQAYSRGEDILVMEEEDGITNNKPLYLFEIHLSNQNAINPELFEDDKVYPRDYPLVAYVNEHEGVEGRGDEPVGGTNLSLVVFDAKVVSSVKQIKVVRIVEDEFGTRSLQQ